MINWLTSPNEKPGWIADNLWDQLDVTQQQQILQDILTAIQEQDWTAWIGEISTQNRLVEASIDEWLVILEGGRDVWPLHPFLIVTEANSERTKKCIKEGRCFYVNGEHIFLWTGHVKYFPEEDPEDQLWYEIKWCDELGDQMSGWYEAAVLDEFIFPTLENDTRNAGKNRGTVFDLSKQELRFPSDPEIDEAIAEGRNAAQYIDIERVIDRKLIHKNLCGEFCVAALMGKDMIPLLQEWRNEDPYKELAENLNCQHLKQGQRKTVDFILKCNWTTGLGNLQSILSLDGIHNEIWDYKAHINPTSPKRIKDMILSGKKAIVGVMQSTRSELKRLTDRNCGTGTPHWVVIEDAIPVGNSGWIRIYNPFCNHSQVYTFDEFIASTGPISGMWVDHN
jgi:hypothetical protein